MAQRWLVVYAQAAVERAAARLKHATQRDDEALTKARLHLQAQRVPTPEAAQDALAAVATRGPYHQVEASHRTEHPRAAGTGRPTARTPRQASAWHIQAHVRPADEVLGYHQHLQAGGVLGTQISASALSNPEVIAADNSPSQVEGGCRWLKEPQLCVSSWCVKQPSRMHGRLRVMTLAWLVSSVTQRRRRPP